MTVIGFDPGSISFGVGILYKEGSKISLLHSEEIKLKENDFYLKMRTLWQRLDELYKEYSLDSAAIEDGFLGKNVKSMNILSKVRGVVLGSLLVQDIPLTFYSPREIKVALTGSGNAPKFQVGKMIGMLLNLPGKRLGSDEGDALAVAYCHMLTKKIN